MKGISYLRKLTGMSVIEFANELSISRSTLEKWECGSKNITDKNKAIIWHKFGFPEEMIDLDLTAEDVSLLQNSYTLPYEYSVDKREQMLNDAAYIAAYEAKCKELESRYQALFSDTDENKLKMCETLMQIYDAPNGPAIVHVILMAAGQCLDIPNTYLRVGQTDYAKGLIHRDDPVLSIIANALKIICR